MLGARLGKKIGMVKHPSPNLPTDDGHQQDFPFLPDGQRAVCLDRQIRCDLGASLEHLCSCYAGIVPYDPVALQRMISGLRAGARYGPAAFALYTDPVFALHQNDHGRAGLLFSQLALLEPQDELCRILPFVDAEFTPHREHNLTLMEFGEGGAGTLRSMVAESLASFLADHHWAMDRMTRDLPELAGEIRAVVAKVIPGCWHRNSSPSARRFAAPLAR